MRFKKSYLLKTPIPKTSESDKKAISSLVQNCLDAKGQNVTHWEAENDQIVARFYGLTTDDLTLITGRTL